MAFIWRLKPAGGHPPERSCIIREVRFGGRVDCWGDQSWPLLGGVVEKGSLGRILRPGDREKCFPRGTPPAVMMWVDRLNVYSNKSYVFASIIQNKLIYLYS